ncbi:MAG TPA: alpha/beta fold hydrolase [Planctomycetota bacterium]|nr:alpha/beta fold hydrolase [Planctomycetota bacterium]
MPTLLDFIPHPWLRSGNLQTIIGSWGFVSPERALRRLVTVSGGDQVVLHDDQPASWCAGDRTALLVHGLCGSHRSAYLVRIAIKLNAIGVRTFRLDMRGCGAGRALARHPYHSGRSDDLAAAITAIAGWCPASPCALVAFSLGANAALKLLGECGDRPPGHLDRAVAVCPPVDLGACVRSLERYPARIYDRFFTSELLTQVHASPTLGEHAARIFARWLPTRLIEFDDAFTAPLSGFGDEATYYRQCSAAPLLSRIRIPATILAAEDDPIVPVAPLLAACRDTELALMVSTFGGHLGFIIICGSRWMDDQVITLATAQS